MTFTRSRMNKPLPKCQCLGHKGRSHPGLKQINMRLGGYGNAFLGWSIVKRWWCKRCRDGRRGRWRYAKDG